MKYAIPTESQEQITLFQWASYSTKAHPELDLLYHIPNGEKRSIMTATRLKAEGVKPGVPDLCLPVPRGEWHGLYIELKRRKGGKVQPEQTEWMEALARQGYCVALCKGSEAAQKTILGYLNTKEA
jgi:hypothetical protein